MLSTIVFDLDDTLYDEIEYCRSGFHSVADFVANSTKKFSSEHLFDAFWSQLTSGNHTRTFNAALEDIGLEYDDEFRLIFVGDVNFFSITNIINS